MGIFSMFKKKKDDLPLIARVNIAELMKQRQEELKNNPPEISILASADFTDRLRERIRLFYVSMERFNRYGGGKRIGQTFGASCTFKAPKGMDLKQACKVVSYLSELVEKDGAVEEASELSVQIVGAFLRNLGFEKEDENAVDFSHRHSVSFDTKRALDFEDSKVLPYPVLGTNDLFTVGGDIKVFEQSSLMDRYFEWFTPGVTEEEVRKIYDEIGFDLDKTFSIEEICKAATTKGKYNFGSNQSEKQ